MANWGQEIEATGGVVLVFPENCMRRWRNLLHVARLSTSPGHAWGEIAPENYSERVDVGLIINILIGAALPLRACTYRIRHKPLGCT
jgi:hypothetical protein